VYVRGEDDANGAWLTEWEKEIRKSGMNPTLTAGSPGTDKFRKPGKSDVQAGNARNRLSRESDARREAGGGARERAPPRKAAWEEEYNDDDDDDDGIAVLGREKFTAKFAGGNGGKSRKIGRGNEDDHSGESDSDAFLARERFGETRGKNNFAGNFDQADEYGFSEVGPRNVMLGTRMPLRDGDASTKARQKPDDGLKNGGKHAGKDGISDKRMQSRGVDGSKTIPAKGAHTTMHD
jgi:hypothetical protein